jgi:hypothetical protein
MLPGSSIDARRKKFIDRESQMRRSHHTARLDRIRKTKQLFGPTLAVSTTDPTYLAGERRVNSAKPAQVIGDSSRRAQDTSVFATQTNDTHSKSLSIVAEANMLCDLLESAIGRGDFTGLSLAIELSLKVVDEISITRSLYADQAKAFHGTDTPVETLEAFQNVIGHEKSLLTLQEIVAAEPLQPECRGRVEAYAFSPAHDALVCIVDADDAKHLYPALKLDHLPRIGDRVDIAWHSDHGEVRPDTLTAQYDTGRRRRPGV